MSHSFFGATRAIATPARGRATTFLTHAISCGAMALLAATASTNAAAAASDVYVAQSAQGAGTGASCGNARAASWVNSSSNWGTGSTQIGAGTTVRLCGTVSTSFTLQGNGSSTAPVTIDGSGASYAGTFNTANRSYWRIQNVTWVNNTSMQLLEVYGGSNGVFANNSADNVQGGVFLGQYNGAVLPTNITIANNFIRQTTADLGNSQHDLIVTEGSANVVVEGNYLEMRAGGSGSWAHNDAIQTYEKGGTSAGAPRDWTIRYNKIVMNSAATNDRSWMMLEGLKGTNNIYGNVLLGLKGASAANGIATCCNDSSVVFNIYNNTIVAKNGASNNVFNLNAPGTANLVNNIISVGSQTMLTGSMSVKRDHNLWYGSSTPSCTSTELCRVDPKFVDYANDDFALQATSPAIGAGRNLGSGFSTGLADGASVPNPALATRAASGTWDLGAFAIDAAGSYELPAPSGLRVIE